MPYHREEIPTSGAPVLLLVLKELRELWLGRAFWTMLIIVVLLTGYSFIAAVNLYSEASRPALQFPELARGLSPLDGILVPTFGSLYLAVTLLLPFVVIRTVGAEKQSGSLKLLVQTPHPIFVLLAAKLIVTLVAWMLVLVPALVALVFWAASGGHIHAPETANLILGHFLYALVIIGVSFVAAALTESGANAAIIAVGITLAFWVLDFAATGDSGLLRRLAGFSLTAVLRSFEHGVFSLDAALGSMAAALGLLTVAGAWLHPGQPAGRRWLRTAAVVVMAAIVIGAAPHTRFFRDATENRRNSFSPTDETALRTMHDRLTIDVYLAPEDPRLYDLEQSILGKLRRTMSNVEIISKGAGTYQAPASGSDDQYGQVIYRYNGHQASSRSTSEEEVLPLLFELAGLQRPSPDQAVIYRGYPLVADTSRAVIFFYLLAPSLVLVLWVATHGGFDAVRRSWEQTIKVKKGGI